MDGSGEINIKDAAAVDTPADAPPAERDWEAEARTTGWRPAEEFKGDPKKLMDAKTWVERGETFLPFIKKDRDETKRELAELKRTLKQYTDFASKAEERAYKRALAEIEARHAEAVETGDVAAAKAAVAERDAIRADAAKPVETEADDAPVDAQQRIRDWIDGTEWYFTDEPKTKYADIQSDLLIKEHGALHKFPGGLDAALAEIGKRVDRKFAAKPVNPVNVGGNRAAPSGGSRGYSDLPAAAKQACDRFVKTIPGYTREQYVKDYDWS